VVMHLAGCSQLGERWVRIIEERGVGNVEHPAETSSRAGR
jgi:hypothetical protein